MGETSVSNTTDAPDYRDRVEALTGVSLRSCPIYHEGHMRAIDPSTLRSPPVVNTS
jgi:hypothetical protein